MSAITASWPENKINTIKNEESIRTSLRIQETTLSLMVDTGSPINIIDETTYARLKNKPLLDKCDTTYYGYTSETPINFLGKFETSIETNGKRCSANFYVVKGRQEGLISCATAIKMGIITVNRIENEPTVDEPKPCELVEKFPNLFGGQLGCATNYMVRLEVDPTIKPVRQPQRPVPFHMRAKVEEELAKQVEQDILERVERNSGPTPWVSNLVIVPKERPVSPKSGGAKTAEPRSQNDQVEIRITCDSRALNKAIKRTRFPTKTIEDLAYIVNGGNLFSKLDIRKAFHQLPLAEESRNLTTVTTHVGLFRYKRLHMGISCASEIFAETLRVMLEDLPGQVNMADDILVFGRSKSEHLKNLLAVLQRLEENGLTLNIDKCEFFKQQLTFFGLRFSSKGISPTEDRCRALREAPEPTNAKDLKSFLCSVLYSSRFIPDLMSKTEPLWNLTRATAEWLWTDKEKTAFREVKDAISTAGTKFFDKLWRTELIVDASPVGLSGILAQVNPKDETEKAVVCCASRLLTDVERRYSQCEKEALAAVWGCERFWIYLFGKPFTLITDNRAVQILLNNPSSKPPARIERLALRLSQFDFLIVHRPGLTNISDYYSRHPVEKPPEGSKDLNIERYVNTIAYASKPDALTMREVIDATRADSELEELINIIRSGANEKKCPKRLDSYRAVFDELNVSESGVLMRGQRVIIPKNLRQRVLALAHAGHQGIVKTKALVRARVWFPGIDVEVEKLVKYCRQCQATSDRPTYEPLRPSEMPPGPWMEVSGDFFGPMADGQFWFVNHDEYSRWASVDKVKSCGIDHVKPILEQLFATIGTPLVYKTDNGAPFQSYEFARFAKAWGFHHRRVTPLWPRANAGVESFMKKLGKVLKTAEIGGEDKQKALREFLQAYRGTPHSSTGVAPAILLMGFSRTTGIPMVDVSPADPSYLSDIHRKAQQNDRKAKDRMKQEFDARMRTKEPSIGVGSLVLLKRTQTSKKTSAWDPDPFRVTRTNGSMIEAKRTFPREQAVVRNSSFFKPYRYEEAYEEDLKVETRGHEGEAANVMSGGGAEVVGSSGLSFERREEASAEANRPAEQNGGSNGDPDARGSSRQEERAKPGRPTKDAAEERKAQWEQKWQAQRQANPPKRQSKRLANLPPT